MEEVVKVFGKIPDATQLLREAMMSQRFADVALSCSGGQRFLAHRLVLSAASPYLQEVLLAHSRAGNCEPTTVVILPEVEATELAALLAFVYTGTAMIARSRLEAFIRAAETLRIPLPSILPRQEKKFNPNLYDQYHRFPLCAVCYPDKQEFHSLFNETFITNTPSSSSLSYENAEITTSEGKKDEEEEYVDVTGSDEEYKEKDDEDCRKNGQDLSCREICCQWRRTKRNVVSNYVTASPWEQIVRVHHSPKNRLGVALSLSTTSSHSKEEKKQETMVPEKDLGKVEISHPVSRLCDTVDVPKDVEIEKEKKVIKNDDDDNNNNNNNNHDRNETTMTKEGEKISRNAHKCHECGKSFVTRASLKVHGRTHSGEKPFRCDDCGKEFSQLRNYKYHRSVHEGTKEFAATCPECGKYFNDRGYLSSHMKIHRNRKEYGCAECGKSFNQRVAYNMHVRIHTGLKPHQCEQCGKAFSRKMLLKQHLRTHSGERPYQCEVCHKAFADRSNMTLHTRLHSGLKPYQCTLCSKAFTKKHHLKTHLNYHTGTKPYACTNCGLRFSQSSNMRTHFKKCTVNNHPTGPNTTDSVALTPPNSDQESNLSIGPSSIPSQPAK